VFWRGNARGELLGGWPFFAYDMLIFAGRSRKLPPVQ
jgi:hypothetical protein